MKTLTIILMVSSAFGAMSLTTETVTTSNKTTTTVVFRNAGDMTSSNKVSAIKMVPTDKLTSLQNTFLTKKELDAKEKATGIKPVVLKMDEKETK